MESIIFEIYIASDIAESAHLVHYWESVYAVTSERFVWSHHDTNAGCIFHPGLLEGSFDVGMRGSTEIRIHFVSGDARNLKFSLSVSLLKSVQVRELVHTRSAS